MKSLEDSFGENEAKKAATAGEPNVETNAQLRKSFLNAPTLAKFSFIFISTVQPKKLVVSKIQTQNVVVEV